MKLDFRIDKPNLVELHKLAKELQDPKDFLREVGDVIVEDIHNRIVKTKMDVNDVPFAPWAASTAKARAKKGNAALGILFDTGELNQSITSRLTSKNQLQVGTNSPYAAYLNDGTSKMPARQFMGISKRAMDGVNEVIALHFGDRK